MLFVTAKDMQMVVPVHSTNYQAFVLVNVKETRVECNVIIAVHSIISFHGDQGVGHLGQTIPTQNVKVLSWSLKVNTQQLTESHVQSWRSWNNRNLKSSFSERQKCSGLHQS